MIAALACSLCSVLAPPQDPVPPAPAGARATDLEVLLAEVARAHRGERAALAVKTFTAQMEITAHHREEERITITTDIRFSLEPLRIRYKVDEGGRRLERGLDRAPGWVRFSPQEPAKSLGEKEYAGDREQLQKELRLARQMLRFLDPAEVVRRFAGEAVLGAEELPVGQGRLLPCRTISGRVAAFPLYTLSGDERPAELRLWIDAATHRLVQVQAFPLAQPDLPAPEGELVRMPAHAAQDGVLLPARLLFYRVTREGQRTPAATIDVKRIQLDVPLGEAAFDRRQPW